MFTTQTIRLVDTVTPITFSSPTQLKKHLRKINRISEPLLGIESTMLPLMSDFSITTQSNTYQPQNHGYHKQRKTHHHGLNADGHTRVRMSKLPTHTSTLFLDNPNTQSATPLNPLSTLNQDTSSPSSLSNGLT